MLDRGLFPWENSMHGLLAPSGQRTDLVRLCVRGHLRVLIGRGRHALGLPISLVAGNLLLEREDHHVQLLVDLEDARLVRNQLE